MNSKDPEWVAKLIIRLGFMLGLALMYDWRAALVFYLFWMERDLYHKEGKHDNNS